MARKAPRRNPEGGSPAVARESTTQRAAREKEEERLIYNRLIEEFGGGPVTPQEASEMDAELKRLEEQSRASRRKR
jgi:hypothetical protein